jgi:hypothetical protein
MILLISFCDSHFILDISFVASKIKFLGLLCVKEMCKFPTNSVESGERGIDLAFRIVIISFVDVRGQSLHTALTVK